MTTRVLRGVADASGTESNQNETVLMISGCLGTKWEEFDVAWQDYLKKKGFKPHKKTNQYVFHTSSFKSGNWKYMPDGLSIKERELMYAELVGLVRDYSEYCFGLGVYLNDWRRFEETYPHVRSLYKRPGTHLCRISFAWNSGWAMENGFERGINWVFDQGDEFWNELKFEDYERARRAFGDDDLNVSSLTVEDKAKYSPLQAADVVAWESANHFRLAGQGKTIEFERLSEPDKSLFDCATYDYLESDFRQRLLRALEAAPEAARVIVGEFDRGVEIDTLLNMMLQLRQEDRNRRRQEHVNNMYAKRKKRSKVTDKRKR